MKIILTPVSLLAILYLGATQSYAQSLNNRDEQLTEVSKKIREYYIFENVANKLATKLESDIERGIFENLSDQEFADSLSSYLVVNSNDRHFNVSYKPNYSQESTNEKELMKAANEINRKWNYGFEKVERLDGNIGYIEYTGFTEGNSSAIKILDATMNFVSNTSALIIDLRDNRGGDGKMVELFLSYFYDKKIQLGNSYTRYSGRTTKSFTRGTVNGRKYLNRPIYILVNNLTISAAEAMAYELQARKEAIVIGETTYGAANPIKVFLIDNSFSLFIPVTQGRNTITNANWEHTGVPIDINLKSKNALTKAHIIALEQIIRTNTDAELSVEEMREKIKELRRDL